MLLFKTCKMYVCSIGRGNIEKGSSYIITNVNIQINSLTSRSKVFCNGLRDMVHLPVILQVICSKLLKWLKNYIWFPGCSCCTSLLAKGFRSWPLPINCGVDRKLLASEYAIALYWVKIKYWIHEARLI